MGNSVRFWNGRLGDFNTKFISAKLTINPNYGMQLNYSRNILLLDYRYSEELGYNLGLNIIEGLSFQLLFVPKYDKINCYQVILGEN